jgi:poly(3-hydroxybutyrate) depolymerase
LQSETRFLTIDHEIDAGNRGHAMLYRWYELNRAAMSPARAAAGYCGLFFNSPFNPLTHTMVGRHAAAACELFERTTRTYERPEFGIASTCVGGETVAVSEETVWQRPFCRLVHFQRDLDSNSAAGDPRVLVVAPMSGHFATLLRGTIETLLPDHDVFVTDWQDARSVALAHGTFDLDDYIIYLREMLRHLGGDVHIFAVCQPSVPALAAVALMEEDGDQNLPASLILAGGPVDTRANPTAVNRLAVERGTRWFRNNVITTVPWPHAGAGRAVYPGFLQLSGFMSMNFDRHVRAHTDYHMDLVSGDRVSVDNHRKFYDEYLAVMDLTAEFYLQTIDTVFVRQSLSKGEMRHRGRPIDLSAIRRVAVMTIEGEKDDITGPGQCRAAHDLCRNVPDTMKLHYECAGAGHYGIFNGSRFRHDIALRIAQFTRTHDRRAKFIPVTPARHRASTTSRAIKHVAASQIGLAFFPKKDEAYGPAVVKSDVSAASAQSTPFLAVQLQPRVRPKRHVLELAN